MNADQSVCVCVCVCVYGSDRDTLNSTIAVYMYIQYVILLCK